jgi:hypothetical protein
MPANARRYGFGRKSRPRRPVWFVLGSDGRHALWTQDEELALAYALEGFGVEGELARGRQVC